MSVQWKARSSGHEEETSIPTLVDEAQVSRLPSSASEEAGDAREERFRLLQEIARGYGHIGIARSCRDPALARDSLRAALGILRHVDSRLTQVPVESGAWSKLRSTRDHFSARLLEAFGQSIDRVMEDLRKSSANECGDAPVACRVSRGDDGEH